MNYLSFVPNKYYTINIENLKVFEHTWVDFISSLSSKHIGIQFSLWANLIWLRDFKYEKLNWHCALLVSVGLYGDKVIHNIETSIMELVYKNKET